MTWIDQPATKLKKKIWAILTLKVDAQGEEEEGDDDEMETCPAKLFFWSPKKYNLFLVVMSRLSGLNLTIYYWRLTKCFIFLKKKWNFLSSCG